MRLSIQLLRCDDLRKLRRATVAVSPIFHVPALKVERWALKRKPAYTQISIKQLVPNKVRKYVGVQSWKVTYLPTLEILVEGKRNRVNKERKMGEKMKKK